MSWEERNGRKYYYQVRRQNGVPKKRYLGNGLSAVLEARKDEKRRQKEVSDLRQRRELASQLWSVDERMRLIQEGCRTLLHAVHLVAGYRQSNSRNCRKVRQMDLDNSKKTETVSLTETTTIGPDQIQKPTEIPRTFEETVAAIRAGHGGLMGNLRWFLEQDPDVYRTFGDLTSQTKVAWVKHLGRHDPVISASLLMKANEDLEELLGESPTPAQRLLGERVIVAKMQLAYYEQLEATSVEDLVGSKLGEWIARRIRSANHQFQQAVAQLQTVRRIEGDIPKSRPAGALRVYDPSSQKRA